MHPLGADASLVLEAALEEGPPRVDADPDRMGQVFSKLIGNAIKFTPAGGGSPWVPCSRTGRCGSV